MGWVGSGRPSWPSSTPTGMRPTMIWVWWVPPGQLLAIPGRLAALALRLGLPATLARVSVPSGPRRLRRSSRPMIPAQGGLAKQELADCGVGGRLLVLRLARRWLVKSVALMH